MIDPVFLRVFYYIDTGQQVKCEVMDPSRQQHSFIAEQRSYAIEAAKVTKDLWIKIRKDEPGINQREQYYNNAQNIMIALLPERKKDQDDPANHCKGTTKG